MKCPACGAAELVHDTCDTLYTYKGESTTLSAINGNFYPACGEALLDAKESRRISTLMRELIRKTHFPAKQNKKIPNLGIRVMMQAYANASCRDRKITRLFFCTCKFTSVA
jgi:YgiT-type zinc finger domain-containing protein